LPKTIDRFSNRPIKMNLGLFYRTEYIRFTKILYYSVKHKFIKNACSCSIIVRIHARVLITCTWHTCGRITDDTIFAITHIRLMRWHTSIFVKQNLEVDITDTHEYVRLMAHIDFDTMIIQLAKQKLNSWVRGHD
jgi:hypothetical protein